MFQRFQFPLTFFQQFGQIFDFIHESSFLSIMLHIGQMHVTLEKRQASVLLFGLTINHPFQNLSDI
jgi:hypothetical protein